LTGLILVAGFLGAGKTTLMKRMIRHYQDKKLRVIVNEFGRQGTDGALLRELGSAVSEICDGSIFCACRVKEFEDALKNAVSEKADMVLVESSGFSDPVSIRSIINSLHGLKYKGCVTLAGADSVKKVSETSRIVSRQLGISDLIVLNRCDCVEKFEQDGVQDFLKIRYPFTPIVPTVQSEINMALIDGLVPKDSLTESPHARDLALRKITIRISPEMSSRSLTDFIRLFAEDSLRIKGLIQLRDGVFLTDCVGPYVQVSAYEGLQGKAADSLNVLASTAMDLDGSLKAACAVYQSFIREVIE
jgi:G3E family GTPase